MHFLEKLGGKRLLSELVIILRERVPIAAIDRMAALGLLRYIHPDLKLTVVTRHILEEAAQIISWYDLLFLEQSYEKWAVYFLALCDTLSNEQFLDVCIRLAVSEHYRERLAEMRRQGGAVTELFGRKRSSRTHDMSRSEIYHLFRDLSVEVLLYLMARTNCERMKKAVSLYFTQLQNVHCFVNGDDILSMGVPKGPLVGELLDRLLAARLNCEVMSREDEINYIRRACEGVLQ
jgi:tRNA nucleotidyltransferase (CCA-adding enzyme)